MSDEPDPKDGESDDEATPKSKKGLIIVLLVGLLAGGGSFAAVWLGMLDPILGGAPEEVTEDTLDVSDDMVEVPDGEELLATPGAAFHPLDPISVSIGAGGASRQLRIGAVLELPANELDNVIQIAPRLNDGILSYLRAVEPETIEDPTALLLLRSQMLRRARLIAGPDVVQNLLITDFVLN